MQNGDQQNERGVVPDSGSPFASALSTGLHFYGLLAGSVARVCWFVVSGMYRSASAMDR